MNYKSIKKHLQPYVIVTRRRTTINHAFAAAIAPNDEYSAELVCKAMVALGQDPENLHCVYCGTVAQTWDHVFSTVRNGRFSGHGHRLGNLLPCCNTCNSAKGNKEWCRFLAELNLPTQADQAKKIKAYLAQYEPDDSLYESDDHKKLIEIKEHVLKLLAEADGIAKSIRDRRFAKS